MYAIALTIPGVNAAMLAYGLFVAGGWLLQRGGVALWRERSQRKASPLQRAALREVIDEVFGQADLHLPTVQLIKGSTASVDVGRVSRRTRGVVRVTTAAMELGPEHVRTLVEHGLSSYRHTSARNKEAISWAQRAATWTRGWIIFEPVWAATAKFSVVSLHATLITPTVALAAALSAPWMGLAVASAGILAVRSNLTRRVVERADRESVRDGLDPRSLAVAISAMDAYNAHTFAGRMRSALGITGPARYPGIARVARFFLADRPPTAERIAHLEASPEALARATQAPGHPEWTHPTRDYDGWFDPVSNGLMEVAAERLGSLVARHLPRGVARSLFPPTTLGTHSHSPGTQARTRRPRWAPSAVAEQRRQGPPTPTSTDVSSPSAPRSSSHGLGG